MCIYEENQNGDKSHFPQGSHGFTTVHKHYNNNNVLRPTYYERVLVRLVLMVFVIEEGSTLGLDSKKECAILFSY